MNIVTYRQIDPSPAAPLFLAFIITGDDFLPVRFSGATEDAARARAQTHWDEAMAKRAKSATKAKPKPAAGPAPYEEEEAV
jgi:hypothetical protein